MSDWNLPWRDKLLILPVIGFVSVAKIEVLSGPSIRNGGTEAEDLAVEAVACTACGETLVVYGRACGCNGSFGRIHITSDVRVGGAQSRTAWWRVVKWCGVRVMFATGHHRLC